MIRNQAKLAPEESFFSSAAKFMRARSIQVSSPPGEPGRGTSDKPMKPLPIRMLSRALAEDKPLAEGRKYFRLKVAR